MTPPFFFLLIFVFLFPQSLLRRLAQCFQCQGRPDSGPAGHFQSSRVMTTALKGESWPGSFSFSFKIMLFVYFTAVTRVCRFLPGAQWMVGHGRTGKAAANQVQQKWDKLESTKGPPKTSYCPPFPTYTPCKRPVSPGAAGIGLGSAHRRISLQHGRRVCKAHRAMSRAKPTARRLHRREEKLNNVAQISSFLLPYAQRTQSAR